MVLPRCNHLADLIPEASKPLGSGDTSESEKHVRGELKRGFGEGLPLVGFSHPDGVVQLNDGQIVFNRESF